MRKSKKVSRKRTKRSSVNSRNELNPVSLARPVVKSLTKKVSSLQSDKKRNVIIITVTFLTLVGLVTYLILFSGKPIVGQAYYALGEGEAGIPWTEADNIKSGSNQFEVNVNLPAGKEAAVFAFKVQLSGNLYT